MQKSEIQHLISPIDSTRFGISIAKIKESQWLTREVLQGLKSIGVELVIVRIGSENITLINWLETHGFCLKDIQLTYKFDFVKESIRYEFRNPAIHVREALEEDIPAMREIARDSFMDYGHYFADSRLDKAACMEIYSDWTKKAVLDTNVADKYFVAELGGRILGYLFLKVFQKESHCFSYGVLGAVATGSRGGNIFSTICLHSLDWGSREGHDWQEHNVLHTNYPVNRVFSKLGFFNAQSQTTLHGWMDEIRF